MEEITHVVAYEAQGQSVGIYKWGCDWLFTRHDRTTGEIRVSLCLCFQQASDLLDAHIEKTKTWIN
jgi:hypothetical protein